MYFLVPLLPFKKMLLFFLFVLHTTKDGEQEKNVCGQEGASTKIKSNQIKSNQTQQKLQSEKYVNANKEKKIIIKKHQT